jgi:hypothetical protein
MGQDVAYCDAFLTVGPKRTRSRLPSTPGIGPATRRHSSTTAKRVGLDPGAGCIYQAQCQEGLCRSSERGASVGDRAVQTPSTGTVRLLVQIALSLQMPASKIVWWRAVRSSPNQPSKITARGSFDNGSAGAGRRHAGGLPSDSDHASESRSAGRRVNGAPRTGSRRHTARVEFQTTQDGEQPVPPKTPRSRRTLPLPHLVGQGSGQTHRRVPASRGRLTLHHGQRQPVPAPAPRRRASSLRPSARPAGTTSHAG